MAHNFPGIFARHTLNFFNAADCQRAGYYDDASLGHAEGGCPGVGRAGEGAGDDANRGDSLGFGGHCVVETPRRAGASIRYPVDYGITLRG